MNAPTSSSPGDRLNEISRVYQDAFNNLADDLAGATTSDQAAAILANERHAEGRLLAAAKQALDSTGLDVETALKAACSANDLVDQGRQQALKLAQLFGLMTRASDAATKLLAAATSAPKAV